MENTNKELSFEFLNETINGDKKIGRECLIEIVKKYDDNKRLRKELSETIHEIDKKIRIIDDEMKILRNGQKNIFGLLDLETPLAIIEKGELYVISSSSMSIEKNIL